VVAAQTVAVWAPSARRRALSRCPDTDSGVGPIARNRASGASYLGIDIHEMRDEDCTHIPIVR
jgi:hypothetical protein